jgi:uncharacterized protein YciI
MKLLLFLLLTSTLALSLSAQNRDSLMAENKQYFFVFLNKGPNRTQDSATAARIQREHLAYMTTHYNAGRYVLAGPFFDDWNTRGIIIVDVPTMAEADSIVRRDPAVLAGRLSVEIHPWFATRKLLLLLPEGAGE